MASTDATNYLYPEDTTGKATTNLVSNEKQTLSPPEEAFDFHFILAKAGPYFRNSMVVTDLATGNELKRGVDWAPCFKFNSATYELQSVEGGVYLGILFYDLTRAGQVKLQYQTLGGQWTLDENTLLEILSNRAVDPRFVTYETVAGKPNEFPPIDHNHPADDLTGMSELITATYDVAAAIREQTNSFLTNPPILMDQYYTKDEADATFASKTA